MMAMRNLGQRVQEMISAPRRRWKEAVEPIGDVVGLIAFINVPQHWANATYLFVKPEAAEFRSGFVAAAARSRRTSLTWQIGRSELVSPLLRI
jgi:hypothetical protein